jgi:hypothetical protein
MELPLSDHMRGLDPSQGRLGRMEGLEAKHGGRDPLYEAMILFDDVVEVFDLKSTIAPPLSSATFATRLLPHHVIPRKSKKFATEPFLFPQQRVTTRNFSYR